MKKLFLIIMASVLLTGCRTITKIEQIEVHDTIVKTNTRVDSVDRWRTHYEYLKGDTVHSVDSFYYAKYIFIHDTLVQHDVEYRDRDVEKVVEKKVPVWWPLWVALCIVAVCGIFYHTRRWLDEQDRKDEADLDM